MNQKELEEFLKFQDAHNTCYAIAKKTEKFKIILTATGLGYQVIAKCCSCKEKKDISDYDCW